MTLKEALKDLPKEDGWFDGELGKAPSQALVKKASEVLGDLLLEDAGVYPMFNGDIQIETSGVSLIVEIILSPRDVSIVVDSSEQHFDRTTLPWDEPGLKSILQETLEKKENQ